MDSRSSGPGWPRSTDQPIMSRPLLPTELRALPAESIGLCSGAWRGLDVWPSSTVGIFACKRKYLAVSS